MLIQRGSCLVLGITAFGALTAGSARAHFVLQSPPALSEQNALGDPQKAPPCGDDGSAVATGMVTSYKAGDVITITIDETIYHPGHYRVALAMNDISELPEPPPVTPAETDCGSAPIANPPVFPVLADGIFLHTEPFAGPQSFEVTLPPNISCDNCTLQVIQFMSDHGLNNPGGCYYHHCANIAVEAGEAPVTTGAEDSSGEGTTSSTTSTSATTQDDTAAPQTTADESTGNATGATGTGGPTTATGTGGEPTTAATDSSGESSSGTTANDADEGGCGCTSSSNHAPATLLGLLGLLGLGTRRRPR